MKIFVCLYVVLVAYLFHKNSDSVSGQYFEDPKKNFQFIQMDLVHRGSFNNTDCLRELLNCWEIIKADYICSYWVVFESVCGLMRGDCSEKAGFSYRDVLPIYEGLC